MDVDSVSLLGWDVARNALGLVVLRDQFVLVFRRDLKEGPAPPPHRGWSLKRPVASLIMTNHPVISAPQVAWPVVNGTAVVLRSSLTSTAPSGKTPVC